MKFSRTQNFCNNEITKNDLIRSSTRLDVYILKDSSLTNEMINCNDIEKDNSFKIIGDCNQENNSICDTTSLSETELDEESIEYKMKLLNQDNKKKQSYINK